MATGVRLNAQTNRPARVGAPIDLNASPRFDLGRPRQWFF